MRKNSGKINMTDTSPMMGCSHNPHTPMSNKGIPTHIKGYSGTPPNMAGRVQPLNIGSLMIKGQLK